MKRKLSVLALLPLIALAGCNKEPSVEDAVSDLQPGQLPENAEQISAMDVYNAFKDYQPNLLVDALEVEISDLHASYSATISDGTNTVSNLIALKDASAKIQVKGLTTAQSFNDLDAAVTAKASFDVNAAGADTEAAQIAAMLNGKTFEAGAYLDSSKVYVHMNNELLTVAGAPEGTPNDFYAAVPTDELNEELEDLGLTFPLLTQELIDMVMSEVEIPTEEELNEMLPEGLTLAKLETMATSVLDEFFDFTKVDETYFAVAKLNKDNLTAKINASIDHLNTAGVLSLMMGEEAVSTLPAEQVTEMKTMVAEQVTPMLAGLNDLSLSVAFDKANGLRKLAFNLDYTMTSSYEGATQTGAIKAGATIAFKYNDEVTISFPDFSNYVNAETHPSFGGSADVEEEAK